MTKQEYEIILDSILNNIDNPNPNIISKEDKPLEISSNDNEFLELIETGLDL